jgi:flap endonuclease-1
VTNRQGGITHHSIKFIDLCILLGCDYTDSIRGVGPKNAFNLIKEHKTIDEAVKHLTPKMKEGIPEDWKYKEARGLFKQPEVVSGKDVKVLLSLKKKKRK